MAQIALGTGLTLTAVSEQAHDRVEVALEQPGGTRSRLGDLPSVGEIATALKRGWARCWLADRRATAARPDGAVVLFVVVYDP